MESKLNDMIKTSLESIRDLVDVNTVVGEPIAGSAGVTIIPISKVSVGYASGGLDYLGKQPAAQRGIKNFGGGGGTGVSVVPVGFLVIKSDGNVQLLNMDAPQSASGNNSLVSNIMDIVDKSPEFIAKMKAAFGSKDKSKDKIKEDIATEVKEKEDKTKENEAPIPEENKKDE